MGINETIKAQTEIAMTLTEIRLARQEAQLLKLQLKQLKQNRELKRHLAEVERLEDQLAEEQALDQMMDVSSLEDLEGEYNLNGTTVAQSHFDVEEAATRSDDVW